MNKRNNGLKVLSLTLISLSLTLSNLTALPARADNIVQANIENPGAAIDLPTFLATDKQTLVYIHSPHCPPCRALDPSIVKLSDKKSDLKIVEVTLDAPTDKGIGFMSEAAAQFEAYSVPTFILYNEHGKKISRGVKARKQVDKWLTENHIEG